MAKEFLKANNQNIRDLSRIMLDMEKVNKNQIISIFVGSTSTDRKNMDYLNIQEIHMKVNFWMVSIVAKEL